MFKYIFFILPFLYLSHWSIWNSMIKGFFIQKTVTKKTDKSLTDFIYKKTKIKISSFNLQKSDKSFAYCGWLWGKPLLVISSTAYEKFKGDAREWLVLHEIGHYALWHTFWFILVELMYILLGVSVLSFVHLLPLFVVLAVLLSFVLASISIQTNKMFDIWANQYSVRRIDNPKGMAEGMKLFIRQARESGVYQDNLLMKFFYPWNYGMYNRGIIDSERELERRKSNH